MIYLYYGDSKSNHSNAQTLVKGLIKKKPNASLFKYDDESWERGEWEEKIKALAKDI